MTGERAGPDDIAAAEGLHRRYVDKGLNLAWLAPGIVEAILAGRRLRDYTLPQIMDAGTLTSWQAQHQKYALV